MSSSIEKTYHMLSQNYYWPHMHNSVEQYVKSCHCTQHKNTNHQQHAELQQRPINERKFAEITMDFITGLPKTTKNNNGILVIVDRLTKWCCLIPYNASGNRLVPAAETTADMVYRHWVVNYGIPQHITTDRDPQFTSKFWKELWKLQGTELGFSTAYHPQTDGQTERTNRTLEEMLRIMCSESPTEWDIYLPHAQHAINTTPQSSINISPYEFVYNQLPSKPVDRIAQANVPLAQAIVNDNIDIQQKAIESLNKARHRQKQYYDKHVKPMSFDIGSYAYVHTANLRAANDSSRKLIPKWAGPFKVIDKIGEVAYKLKLPQTLIDKNLHDVFHINKLQKYNPRNTTWKDNDNNILVGGPELIDGEHEWEVDKIVDSKKRGNNMIYLVRWKGWNRYHDSWELESELVNARDKINEYNRNKNTNLIDQALNDVLDTSSRAQQSNYRTRLLSRNNVTSILCGNIDNIIFNINITRSKTPKKKKVRNKSFDLVGIEENPGPCITNNNIISTNQPIHEHSMQEQLRSSDAPSIARINELQKLNTDVCDKALQTDSTVVNTQHSSKRQQSMQVQSRYSSAQSIARINELEKLNADACNKLLHSNNVTTKLKNQNAVLNHQVKELKSRINNLQNNIIHAAPIPEVDPQFTLQDALDLMPNTDAYNNLPWYQQTLMIFTEWCYNITKSIYRYKIQYIRDIISNEHDQQYAHIKWEDSWVPIDHVTSQAITQYHNHIRSKQELQHRIQQNNEQNQTNKHQLKVKYSGIKREIANLTNQSSDMNRMLHIKVEDKYQYHKQLDQITNNKRIKFNRTHPDITHNHNNNNMISHHRNNTST